MPLAELDARARANAALRRIRDGSDPAREAFDLALDWSLSREGFLSNNAGGVLGGISTGQDLEVSIAIKPTSSIITPRQSIDTSGQPAEVITKGRHDPCVGIRATPIAEAMLALVVMEHALRQRAQNADVQVSTPDIMRGQKV